jgi:hypothetical protein
MHTSETAAHQAAKKYSKEQPVHIWTTKGGSFGMGEAIAHYNNGVRTDLKKK